MPAYQNTLPPICLFSGDVVSASITKRFPGSGTYARKRRTTFRSRHVAWRADRPPSYRDGPDFARDSFSAFARRGGQVFPASEVAAAQELVDFAAAVPQGRIAGISEWYIHEEGSELRERQDSARKRFCEGLRSSACGDGIAAICRMKYPAMTRRTALGSLMRPRIFLRVCSVGLFTGSTSGFPRLLRRRLNAALGFVQTFLCFALLLFGLFPVWIVNMGALPCLTRTTGVTIAILGEALFVVNVCWMLLQPESAVALVPAAQRGR